MIAHEFLIRNGNPEYAFATPPVNIRETDKEYVVEAEMPGAAKDKIEITLQGDVVSIYAKRESSVPEGHTVLHQEIFPSEYQRELNLGSEVERESVQAAYENGILTLKFRKAEKAIPKKILIQ